MFYNVLFFLICITNTQDFVKFPFGWEGSGNLACPSPVIFSSVQLALSNFTFYENSSSKRIYESLNLGGWFFLVIWNWKNVKRNITWQNEGHDWSDLAAADGETHILSTPFLPPSQASTLSEMSSPVAPGPGMRWWLCPFHQSLRQGETGGCRSTEEGILGPSASQGGRQGRGLGYKGGPLPIIHHYNNTHTWR